MSIDIAVVPVAGLGTRLLPATKSQPKEMLPVGRKPVVGRPFMYGTTREFLERFGLNDINDLPKVDDLSDALGFELFPQHLGVAGDGVLARDVRAKAHAGRERRR